MDHATQAAVAAGRLPCYAAVAKLKGHHYAELRDEFLQAVKADPTQLVETPGYHSRCTETAAGEFFQHITPEAQVCLLRVLQRAADAGDHEACMVLDTTSREYADCHEEPWL